MVSEWKTLEDSDNLHTHDFYHEADTLRVSDDFEGEDDFKSQILENRNWSWRYMKRQLRTRNLEGLYSRYHQILHKGYFSMFLLLQMIFTVIHVTCLLIKEIDDPLHRTLPDIVSYVSFALLLWPLVYVVFNKNLVKKFPCLPHLVSCVAIGIVVVVDIALPVYHTSLFHSRLALRPAYATHALLACYIFLPLRNSLAPVALGLGITACHILTLIAVTYRNSNITNRQIVSEVIFFLCVNGLGFYYRFINEMIIRRTFLDRRACVEFTMKLNYEKEQEEQLLLSILPWHIATRVREDIRKKSLQPHTDEPVAMKPFKELYIEKHDNVSILYADVVNYTKMTSSLPVNKLVETLNELFGKFDEASEKHKVLRIKFLGDCYYCASGIPQPNPQHAKSCVELGLDMINIIEEVRHQRKLDIDMRIGVHSGSILSGLLGRCKWQYDIWSKDVVIANRMEQSGKPGMVHITKQTFDQLGNEYIVEPGNGHLRDELLNKYNITTFLIRPQEVNTEGAELPGGERAEATETAEFRRSVYEKRHSDSSRKSKAKRYSKRHGADVMYRLQGVVAGDGNMAISRRRTAFMNNNLIMYQQRLKMADVYMEKAIDNLPVGKYNQWFKNTGIHPLSLTFRQKGSFELPFLKRPDPLFKYYVLGALFVSVCMSAMQLWAFPRFHWLSWALFAVSTAGLILLVPLTWSHYIWNAMVDPKRQMDHIPKPENKIFLFLYKCSVKIIWNFYLRTFLYIVVCLLLTGCSLADVINHMNGLSCSDRRLQRTTENAMQCRSPWQITELSTLAVLMSFLFVRVHFQLRLFMGMCVLGLYTFCIMSIEVKPENEQTWNPNMEPGIAQILSLVFIVLGLHLMDREAEFMNRLDYLWKRQLGREKDEAEKTRSINRMLLHNILPIHVAEVYLNTNRASNDLYHENYDCVAVMFASLTNYCLYDDNAEHSEIGSLEILNKVICEFDDALFEAKFKAIEKIKIVGSTYMAACGLDPGQKASNSLNDPDSPQVVTSLVEFATTVMRRLEKINRNFNTNFRLRVGISHGPVTAGVVGSQKPLYDIWGNAVNVASRMDSTGEPGKIQVTSSTAAILQEEGFSCEYRGPIFVKGKGIMQTYFVKLTNDFHLQRESTTI